MTSRDAVGQAIGVNVRAARTAAGLSRKRLAEKADVSERYLNQLENGAANVSVGILGRVAAALDVDLVSLLRPAGDLTTGGRESQAAPGPLAALVGDMSPREQQGAVPVLERYLQERRKSLKGVALIGLRGAGKTTIGQLYAMRHGIAFVSVTREIEARAGMSLNDLFNLGGPDAYRTLENEVVRDISQRPDRIVLETAGGIVGSSSALDVILAAFRTVWLKASPEEHLERVIRQGDMRPLQSTPKALEHLRALLAQREQEYARADFVLVTSGRSVEECVEELERLAGAEPLA